MKTTYTNIQFILNISVVWKIKIPTWLSLEINEKLEWDQKDRLKTIIFPTGYIFSNFQFRH